MAAGTWLEKEIRRTLMGICVISIIEKGSSGEPELNYGIWDTVKGQLQTEFADIASTETVGTFGKKDEGHLSMDYTCMKWLALEKKRKRKLGSSSLVLGTGGGDVLAFDVSAGQLKWRVNNCHPGGVTAISFPSHGLHVYTAGADGFVCEIDSTSGNLLKKFGSSSRGISSLSVSPDGKMIATAAAQLKIFDSSSHKKLQKFSGHPGTVRCMVFSEDGKFLLSSSLGERYIAVWEVDGSKKRSSSLVLAMDNPAIFLDSRCVNSGAADDVGLSVLAITEVGVCYFWHGKSIDGLRNCKPTKISIGFDDGAFRKNVGTLPNIFAGKLQTISEPSCGHVFLAYGLLIKPSFEKVLVHMGTDIKLSVSHDGILLPISQSRKSKKALDLQRQVTTLDRANAEGALLPAPMVFDLTSGKDGAEPVAKKGKDGVKAVTFCMEERLRSVGVLPSDYDTFSSTLDFKILKGINLDEITPHKKIKATVSSMEPADAFKLFKCLVVDWQSRSRSSKHVLPWISSLLVYHSDHFKSQEPKLLDSLYKVTKSKEETMSFLLQLSGRLQLVSAQIDKASHYTNHLLTHEGEHGEESEDEEVDDVIYGADEDSLSSSGSED